MMRIQRLVAAAGLLACLAMPAQAAAASPTTSPSSALSDVEAVCDVAPAPGYASCNALRVTQGLGAATPQVSSNLGTVPYGPADIQGAYYLPGGTAGAGMTVAVVDAYDAPTAETDLAYYRSSFGLPACTTANGCFRKVNQVGQQSNYPAVDNDWAQEIALDLDMVSAACPGCNILLVEANSASFSDLGPAVNQAVAMGAVAVSNSYGGTEFSSEVLWESLNSYYNHPGVAITVSTGDCGYYCTGRYNPTPPPVTSANVAQFPSASQYVVAVGGTSLVKDSSTRGWSESAWGNVTNHGGAGSGCSPYEPKPSWQTDSGCSKRMQADVSAVADPATGVLVRSSGGWYQFGGTSAASPIIAAVYALAGTPTPGTYPASYPYARRSNLWDAVGGNNDVAYGDCAALAKPLYFCNGRAGYDGPTGLGSPNGLLAFTQHNVPGKPTGPTASGADSQATVSWTAPSSDGGIAITSYTVTSSPGGNTCAWSSGQLSCTVTGLTNGTPYTFTVTATNVLGSGTASNPSNSVTPSGLPGKPTGVMATAGHGSATVSWTAPTANGSSITSYTVTSSPDSKTCVWTAGPLTCDVLGLTGGQPYTFTVHAHNGAGDGPESDASNSVTPDPATAPGAPTGVTAIGTDSSAVVSWNAAAANGSPIDSYTATAEPGNEHCTWSSGPLTCTIGGLTNGTTYDITVHAHNGVGTGPESSPAVAVTPLTGATYQTVAPYRALDSRVPTPVTATRFHSQQKQTIQIASVASGVPTEAVAVTGNVTVVSQTRAGFVTVAPSLTNGLQPLTSTINFPAGDTRANGVTVPLASGGKLDFMYWTSYTSDTVQIIFDVTGYFAAGS